MTDLRIFYPFKPFFITQHWGNPNPAYEQFGFSQHNGIDATAYGGPQHGSKWAVLCPVEGFRVHQIRFVPKGGGNEIWLISKDKVRMMDRECHAYLVICHADKILVPVGYEPKLGELIMIADNTGFSTGPHTHMGLYRVDYDGKQIKWLDTNEASGSYPPQVFFTKKYAGDVATIVTTITSAMRYLKYLSGM